MLLDLWGLIQRNLFRGANSGAGKHPIIVEVEGKQFRVPLDSLPSFLKAFEKREAKRLKKTEQPKTTYVVLKEVPREYEPQVAMWVDETNDKLDLVALAIKAKLEQDEEDAVILLLLGA